MGKNLYEIVLYDTFGHVSKHLGIIPANDLADAKGKAGDIWADVRYEAICPRLLPQVDGQSYIVVEDEERVSLAQQRVSTVHEMMMSTSDISEIAFKFYDAGWNQAVNFLTSRFTIE